MDPKHELTIARLKERKAARRQSEVAREVLDALNRGWIESKNLVEWLSVDRLRLAKVVLPELEMDEIDFQSLGQRLRGKSVLQQSKMLGAELAQLLSPTDPRVKRLENHPSDVVREWGALIIGHWESMSFSRRLAWMKPYADDRNPGTREIAWIALRQHVIDDPIEAVSKLMPWTGSRNERLRRYASEITRPCGVWCQHIDALKRDPAIAVTLLEPLKSDEALYVRNSVANWLNDASKTNPDWVIHLTNQWEKVSPSPQTRYIIKRALRTLTKNSSNPKNKT